MRCTLSLLSLTLLLTALGPVRMAVAQPEPSLEVPAEGDLTSDVVWAMDRYRHEIREARDNYFVYQKRVADYYAAVNKLNGRQLVWRVSVDRVGPQFVTLRPAQWGRTRPVLLHFVEDRVLYGNLGYCPPEFNVPPSTFRYFRHAPTPELQIGVQIPLALAKDLRHDDEIKLTGRIDRVETRLEHGNSPDTLLYIANVQASKFMTEEERLKLEGPLEYLEKRK